MADRFVAFNFNYQLSTTLYPVKTSYDVFHFKHFCGLVYT